MRSEAFRGLFYEALLKVLAHLALMTAGCTTMQRVYIDVCVGPLVQPPNDAACMFFSLPLLPVVRYSQSYVGAGI